MANETTLKVRLLNASKTHAEWASADPVLKKGEIAYSSDQKQIRIGDGSSKWSQLSYIDAGHIVGLSNSGSTITYTKADGSTGTITLPEYKVATSTTPGLVKSGTDISVDSSGNVSILDNSHNHTIANVTNLQTTLDAKAPKASPALTGTPTAPTAANGTKTTQIATTEFVQNAVTNATDDIEIGGRNLFKNSATFDSVWGAEGATLANGVATLDLNQNAPRIYQVPASGYWTWEPNVYYTASIEAKASDNNKKITIQFVGLNNINSQMTVTTEWKRYSFTAKSDTVSTASMSFFGVKSSGTIQLRLPKLEKGNKATDWTPAPEDLVSSLSLSGSTLAYKNPMGTQLGTVSITKSTVGLGNVDNTSDANKPVSTATQTALDKKVDKASSVTSGTSLNNYSTSGFYKLSNSHTEVPASNYTSGQLLVSRGNGDTIAQIVMPYTASEMYLRTGNPFSSSGNGTWKDWVRIVDKTYGDTLYLGKTATATAATRLTTNTSYNYSEEGLTWFNVDGTAGAAVQVNDTPTTAWWHILRMNHTNTNAYYTDVAVPFYDKSIYYKIIRNGAVVDSKWIKVLDEDNYKSYALPLSGGTMANPIAIQHTVNTGSVYRVSETLTTGTPFSSVWHDVLAFCRVGTPIYSTTTDGSTWTEATLNKNLFAHKDYQAITVLSSTIKGSRWEWNTTDFAWSSGHWLRIGIANNPTIDPKCYFNITMEQSSDGETWTSLGAVTKHTNGCCYIFMKVNTLSKDRFRITITKHADSADNGTLKITSMQLLSLRSGVQGYGPEYSYPYNWDGDMNITMSGNLFLDKGMQAQVYTAKASFTTTAGKLAGLVAGTSRLYSNGLVMSNPATTNDQAWIRITGTGETDTVLEIATGDDGGAGEKIVARQYNTSNAIAREATLLGTDGSTTFPVQVTAPIFVGKVHAPGVSTYWNKGRDNALVRTTTLTNYSPLASAKTTNGSWDIGTYNHNSYTDDLVFTYITDSDYANANKITAQIKFTETGTIIAGTDGTSAERQIRVRSGAGELYMFSQASDTGTRGLYAPTHGTGGDKIVIGINTNNDITFYGTLSGTATTANTLVTVGRPTTANTLYGDGRVRYITASSSMTEGKPVFAGAGDDANILHLAWDYNSGYDSQIAQRNNTGELAVRGMSAGTWGAWRVVLDSTNYTAYASPKGGSTSLSQLASTIRLGPGNGAIIDQNDGTYRQRINIIDNSTANDAVFTFQQSVNTGSSYTTLMEIDDDGNVIATTFTGKVNTSSLIIGSSEAITSIKNNTSAGALGWSATATDKSILINSNTLAYWNGAHSGTSSNLAYCTKGAFGSIVTKNTGDYLAITGGTVSGTIKVTASDAIRMAPAAGNYASILYCDGSNFYVLCTNANDKDGSYNSLRPFVVNLSSGAVSMYHTVNLFGGIYSNNANNNSKAWIVARSTYYSSSCTQEAYVGASNATHNISLTSGSSGGSAGVWSGTKSKWLISINSSGTVTANTSDIRYKNDLGLTSDEEVMAILSNVHIHNFTYKDDENKLEQNGIFAQELRDVLIEHNLGMRPSLLIQKEGSQEIYYDLNTPEEDVIYSVAYDKFVPLLWRGWQMHETKLAKLSAHEQRILELENRVRELELQLNNSEYNE